MTLCALDSQQFASVTHKWCLKSKLIICTNLQRWNVVHCMRTKRLNYLATLDQTETEVLEGSQSCRSLGRYVKAAFTS